MIDKTEEARRIRDLKTWPRWPWLPVKRSGGDEPAYGVVFADDIDLPNDKDASGPIRVWNVSVFAFDGARAAVGIVQGLTPRWELHGTFDSVEALLEAGWRGD